MPNAFPLNISLRDQQNRDWHVLVRDSVSWQQMPKRFAGPYWIAKLELNTGRIAMPFADQPPVSLNDFFYGRRFLQGNDENGYCELRHHA